MYLACIIEAPEPSTNYSFHLQAAIRVASVLSGVSLQRCVAGQPTTTTESGAGSFVAFFPGVMCDVMWLNRSPASFLQTGS